MYNSLYNVLNVITDVCKCKTLLIRKLVTSVQMWEFFRLGECLAFGAVFVQRHVIIIRYRFSLF